MTESKSWGLLAEFPNPARLLKAAQATHAAGYRRFETFSPFPIHGMDEAMELPGSKVPWITLAAGLMGMATGLALQWWSGSVAYPLVIGGKPLFAWEFALPITFELSILFASFGTVLGMFALNKLPRPNHPLDYVPRFKKVTDDAFFLAIPASDEKFDLEASKAFLESIGGEHITVVEEQNG
ncbi:DUF3341 domain-containing protein [Myxococcota bacterium]|nr:DUF3341 domain-containing protein [Myxococcota bacterium]